MLEAIRLAGAIQGSLHASYRKTGSGADPFLIDECKTAAPQE
jgi:hypothetical protein